MSKKSNKKNDEKPKKTELGFEREKSILQAVYRFQQQTGQTDLRGYRAWKEHQPDAEYLPRTTAIRVFFAEEFDILPQTIQTI